DVLEEETASSDESEAACREKRRADKEAAYREYREEMKQALLREAEKRKTQTEQEGDA
ncbi:unnamed protein product, partial [Amoebophrya sp. A25]